MGASISIPSNDITEGNFKHKRHVLGESFFLNASQKSLKMLVQDVLENSPKAQWPKAQETKKSLHHFSKPRMSLLCMSARAIDTIGVGGGGLLTPRTMIIFS